MSPPSIRANSSRRFRFQPSSLFAWGILWLILVVIHGSRFYLHFQFPAPFAEEGQVFLAGIIEGKLVLVNAGYLNLLTGVMTALFYKISIDLLPLASAGFATVLAVSCLFYFLLPFWKALLPFAGRLFLVVFILCVGPFSEGIACLEYGFWYLGLGSLLLALEVLFLPEQASRYRGLKAAFVVLGCLSGPAVFQTVMPAIAAYVFLFLIKSGWKNTVVRLGAILRQPQIAVIVPCLLIQAYFILNFSDAHAKIPLARVLQFPQASLFQTLMRVVLPSFLSYDQVLAIKVSKFRSYLALMLTMGFFFPLLMFRKNAKRNCVEPVAFFLLSWIFSTWILYLGRPEMFNLYRSSPMAVGLGGTRYSFVPGFFFIAACVFAFCRQKFVWLKSGYAIALIPLVTVGAFHNFFNPDKITDVNWVETARQINAYQEKRQSSVDRAIYPEGWRITVPKPPNF